MSNISKNTLKAGAVPILLKLTVMPVTLLVSLNIVLKVTFKSGNGGLS